MASNIYRAAGRSLALQKAVHHHTRCTNTVQRCTGGVKCTTQRTFATKDGKTGDAKPAPPPKKSTSLTATLSKMGKQMYEAGAAAVSNLQQSARSQGAAQPITISTEIPSSDPKKNKPGHGIVKATPTTPPTTSGPPGAGQKPLPPVQTKTPANTSLTNLKKQLGSKLDLKNLNLSKLRASSKRWRDSALRFTDRIKNRLKNSPTSAVARLQGVGANVKKSGSKILVDIRKSKSQLLVRLSRAKSGLIERIKSGPRAARSLAKSGVATMAPVVAKKPVAKETKLDEKERAALQQMFKSKFGSTATIQAERMATGKAGSADAMAEFGSTSSPAKMTVAKMDKSISKFKKDLSNAKKAGSQAKLTKMSGKMGTSSTPSVKKLSKMSGKMGKSSTPSVKKLSKMSGKMGKSSTSGAKLPQLSQTSPKKKSISAASTPPPANPVKTSGSTKKITRQLVAPQSKTDSAKVGRKSESKSKVGSSPLAGRKSGRKTTSEHLMEMEKKMKEGKKGPPQPNK